MLCFVVAYRYRRRDAKRWRVAFLAALLGVAITVGVFILVNPFLYSQPLLRTVAMLLFRAWEMTDQATNPQWRISDLSARMRILPLRIFRDYPAVHIEFFNELLAALGLYVLARAGWRWLADKRSAAISTTANTGTGVAILIVGAVTALPPLLTPLDWDRYYMYPVLFVSVSVAVGVGWFAGQSRRLVALFAEP
ncbi:MAG: hypothetical protein ACP5J4_15900 [Anaerolineae bacterium]